MKIFAVIGAVLLVVCLQIHALPNIKIYEAGSFAQDVNNLTSLILSSVENPSNSLTLSSKINAFFEVNYMYHFVNPFHRVFFDLRDLAFGMPTSENILNSITNWQSQFLTDFEQMYIERDVDVSDKPSELNQLIDDFISRHTQSLLESFDKAYTQAEKLEVESEKLFANSIALLDNLIKKIDNCLQIAPTEFKDIFHCHEEAWAFLPDFTENARQIKPIVDELNDLLKLNSVQEEHANVFVEKGQIIEKMWAEREKRKADKGATQLDLV